VNLLEANEQLYYIASCDPCKRAVEIDLAAMIQRFGWDYDLDKLRPHLRCTRCGRRRIIITTLWKQATTTTSLKAQILKGSEPR